MFIFNNWYVIAFSTDVEAKPLARMVCGLPVVLYRTDEGQAVALEDRCIHRAMPFSVGGECEGKSIRCPYHALEFGPDGACTKVPGQDQIPPSARVRSYPIVEEKGLIWIWPGATELADPSTVPHPEHHGLPGWTNQFILLEIDANWEMMHDNLLDLTHLGIVHRRTIGGNPDQHGAAEMKVAKVGDAGILVSRQMPASDPPPHYLSVKQFEGKIDRWMEINFIPGVVKIFTGGTDAGTGAYEGRREGGVQFMGFHAITPVTEKTMYYHFSQSFNFPVDDVLAERLHLNARNTLLEDKVVIEAMQTRLDQTPDRPLVDLKSDAGGVQARRIVRRLIEKEQKVQKEALAA